MKAAKFSDLLEMGNDQLEAVLKEAKDNLFRLRVQSHMERLDSPSEIRKNKVIIARIKTIQAMRGSK